MLAPRNVRSDQQERRDQRRGGPWRPFPALPHHDERHHGGHHHGAGHRNAVGRGERARGAKQRDEQQHAEEQEAVDARHVDLPDLGLRGVADLKPRQEAELDRLPRERIGTGNDAWLAMTVAAVASTTIGSSAHSG